MSAEGDLTSETAAETMSAEAEAAEAAEEKKEERRQSQKIPVIRKLFYELWPEGTPRPAEPLIVDQKRLAAAIESYNEDVKAAKKEGDKDIKPLSSSNVANFLKDFIRKKTCNDNWPKELKELSITARQRYGKKQVFEFVDYRNGDKSPFPDHFDPTSKTEVYPFEALSIPKEARALGRADEPWLIQVIVSQKIIYQHLSINFKSDDSRFESLTHLQMSVKTQPEIDTTFLATLSMLQTDGSWNEVRAYITGEAKQFNERILEDQIREQVAQAFKITSELEGNYYIDAVIPMAFKADRILPKQKGESGIPGEELSAERAVVEEQEDRRGIYVAQFEMILRSDFETRYAENLHDLPLKLQSSAFYEPHPPIKGISYTKLRKPTKRKKSTGGKSKKGKKSKNTHLKIEANDS